MGTTQKPPEFTIDYPDHVSFISESIKEHCDKYQVSAYQIASWFDRMGSREFVKLVEQMAGASSIWLSREDTVKTKARALERRRLHASAEDLASLERAITEPLTDGAR